MSSIPINSICLSITLRGLQGIQKGFANLFANNFFSIAQNWLQTMKEFRPIPGLSSPLKSPKVTLLRF